MNSNVKWNGRFFGYIFLVIGMLNCIVSSENQICLTVPKEYGHPVKLLYNHDVFDFPTGTGWTLDLPLGPIVLFALAGSFFIIGSVGQR